MRSFKSTEAFARALRKAMSPPEVRVWVRLRAMRTQGLRFRRQHPIGPFVLDFYCPERKVAVEIDGHEHFVDKGPERDLRRDAWLRDRGITVVRIPAGAVMRDADEVARWIWDAVRETPPQSASPTAPPQAGKQGKS